MDYNHFLHGYNPYNPPHALEGSATIRTYEDTKPLLGVLHNVDPPSSHCSGNVGTGNGFGHSNHGGSGNGQDALPCNIVTTLTAKERYLIASTGPAAEAADHAAHGRGEHYRPVQLHQQHKRGFAGGSSKNIPTTVLGDEAATAAENRPQKAVAAKDDIGLHGFHSKLDVINGDNNSSGTNLFAVANISNKTRNNNNNNSTGDLKRIWQNVLRECHRADPERVGQVSRNVFISALTKSDIDSVSNTEK